MRTVLGLSKTSTSIGWVLVDGRDVTGYPLDHDAFDVTDKNGSDLAATARRARAIATATGYTVDRVRVTSSDHADANVLALRKALAESGFDDVVPVPLAEATQAWAMGVGLADAFAKTAVCVVDRESASLSVIETATGAMKTQTTSSSDSAALIDWLQTTLGRSGSDPESLFLVGSRCRLDAIAGPLGAGLSMPVIADPDAQVILARGAAFSNRLYVNDAAQGRARFPSRALILAGVATIAIAATFTLSSASGPIPLVDRTVQQKAAPSAPQPAEIPASAAPVALPIPPPPPAEPILEPPPAAFIAVLPEVIAPPVVEIVPDPLPVQHLPEAQPGGVPAPGPADLPPIAPASDVPPPAPDPIGQIPFGVLP